MEPELTQQLIVNLGLEHLPEQEREDVLNDAGIVIMTSVVTRGIPLLDETGTARCDELLARDAEISEIFELLKETIPGFQAIVDDEIELLKKTLS
jgi:hypothetical protein